MPHRFCLDCLEPHTINLLVECRCTGRCLGLDLVQITSMCLELRIQLDCASHMLLLQELAIVIVKWRFLAGTRRFIQLRRCCLRGVLGRGRMVWGRDVFWNAWAFIVTLRIGRDYAFHRLSSFLPTITNHHGQDDSKCCAADALENVNPPRWANESSSYDSGTCWYRGMTSWRWWRRWPTCRS